MKQYREMQTQYEAARDAYHEAAGQDTVSQKTLSGLSAKIKETQKQMSDLVLKGVKVPKDAQMHGSRKGPGAWDVINLTTGERARGESADEAVENFNDGVFYTGPGTTESAIGQAPAGEGEAAGQGEAAGTE